MGYSLVAFAGTFTWVPAGKEWWREALFAPLLFLGLGVVFLLCFLGRFLELESRPATEIGTLAAFLVTLLLPLSVAVFEEVLFRGVLLSELRQLVSASAAVALSAVSFGSVHAMSRGGLEALAVFSVFGLFFGFVAVRRGGVLSVVLAHGYWNMVFG